jgi:YD repeat-containing protein
MGSADDERRKIEKWRIEYQVTLGYNLLGQVTSVTDAASDTAQFTYNYGDLAQVTDPLGNVIKRVHRQRRSTDLRRRPAG